MTPTVISPARPHLGTALGDEQRGTPQGEIMEWIENFLKDTAGIVIPTADTGKVTNAATAWGNYSDALTRTKATLEGALPGTLAATFPQQADVAAVQAKLATFIDNVASDAKALGQGCQAYADNVEAIRGELLAMLGQLALEVAIDIGVGIALSFFTFGAGALAAAGKAAMTVARWIPKLLSVVNKLKTLILQAKRTMAVMRRAAIEAIESTVSGTVANAGASLAFGNFSWDQLGGAAISSGIGGMISGPFSHIGSNIASRGPRITVRAGVDGITGGAGGVAGEWVASQVTGQDFNLLMSFLVGSAGGTVAGGLTSIKSPGGISPASLTTSPPSTGGGGSGTPSTGGSGAPSAGGSGAPSTGGTPSGGAPAAVATGGGGGAPSGGGSGAPSPGGSGGSGGSSGGSGAPSTGGSPGGSGSGAPAAGGSGAPDGRVDVPSTLGGGDGPSSTPQADGPSSTPQSDGPSSTPQADGPSSAPQTDGPGGATTPPPPGGPSGPDGPSASDTPNVTPTPDASSGTPAADGPTQPGDGADGPSDSTAADGGDGPTQDGPSDAGDGADGGDVPPVDAGNADGAGGVPPTDPSSSPDAGDGDGPSDGPAAGLPPTTPPRFTHGVRFFGPEQLKYYTTPGSTLGAKGGSDVFMMPYEDAIKVDSPFQAMIETGMADSVTNAVRNGDDVFAAIIDVDHLPQRLPTAADAGKNPNFLLGGNTAVNIDGRYFPNSTREFVVPSGTNLRPTLIMRITDSGWEPYGFYIG